MNFLKDAVDFCLGFMLLVFALACAALRFINMAEWALDKAIEIENRLLTR